MDEHNGGCSCSNVRFVAKGVPLRVGICHCLDCRKHHGAVFYAAAIFDEANVHIVGETRAHNGRHFCLKCGSSVFARTDAEIELHLGSFDVANNFTPTYETWCIHREAWLPPFPETTKFMYEREHTF